MKAAHAPIALNQRNDRSFTHRAAPEILALASVLIGFLSAEIGFINLYNLVVSAERPGIDLQFSHCLANPMPEKPCGFHAAIQGPLDLPRGEPLFRRTEQVAVVSREQHSCFASIL